MSQMQGPVFPPPVAGMVSPDGYYLWDGARWVPRWQPPAPVVPFFRSGSTLALWARIGIALNMLALLLMIVADAGRVNITSRIISGEGVSLVDAQASDDFVRLSSVLELGTLLLAAVAFSLWIHRATSNGPALGGAQLRFTPGWAVGWFYVPIANLFRPFQVVSEVWRTSDPRVGMTTAEQRAAMKVSPLVTAWWTLFVLAALISRYVFFSIRSDTADSLHGAAIADIVGSVSLIVAGILAVALVGAIDTRQTQKHLATLAPAPAPASASA
jgi:hypothetical protein